MRHVISCDIFGKFWQLEAVGADRSHISQWSIHTNILYNFTYINIIHHNSTITIIPYIYIIIYNYIYYYIYILLIIYIIIYTLLLLLLFSSSIIIIIYIYIHYQSISKKKVAPTNCFLCLVGAHNTDPIRPSAALEATGVQRTMQIPHLQGGPGTSVDFSWLQQNTLW